MRIIGITGTMGAGKGTVVDYLVSNHGFKHYSARSVLNEMIAERKMEPGRDSMRKIANELREQKGPAALIELLFDKARQFGKDAIIESVRTEGEVVALRNSGYPFTLLGVDANPKIRYHRAVERGSSTDKVSFEKFVEQEKAEMTSTNPNEQNLSRCMELADYKLQNDGTVEEFHKSIESFLTKVSQK